MRSVVAINGLVAAMLLLQGCAVSTQQRGNTTKVNFGLDTAQILGTEIGCFATGDGSRGAIRLLDEELTLKLSRYQKVVPLARANAAQIVDVSQLGDRTNILLRAATRDCAATHYLISIRDSEVLKWKLSGCGAGIELAKSPNAQIIDVEQRNGIKRYVFENGRLSSGRIDQGRSTAVGPGSALPLEARLDEPRYSPRLPTRVVDGEGSLPGASQQPTGSVPSGAVARPVSRATTVDVLPASELQFEAVEERPVRVMLEDGP